MVRGTKGRSILNLEWVYPGNMTKINTTQNWKEGRV